MGLTSSPRVFTKLLKPAFAYLRSLGHISTAYIDDSCLQAATYNLCEKKVTMLDSLGLTINLEKSVLQPCQTLVFLGFMLCSTTMTVHLTETRKLEIKEMCLEMLKKDRVKIRQFAKLIGKLVAAEPGVDYATLYIKPLEKVKEVTLKTIKVTLMLFSKYQIQSQPY